LNNLKQKIAELHDGEGKVSEDFKTKFESYLADDFNLPQALALVFDVLKSPSLSDADLPAQAGKLATILDFDKVLGLDLGKAPETAKIPPEIEALAQEREVARQAKNWSKSDELRQKLADLGYEVLDSAEGPKIRKI
jgi:cysteinyl-tRNA synthetase